MRTLRNVLQLAAVAATLWAAPASAQTVHKGEHESSDEVLWGCNDTYLVSNIYKESARGTINEAAIHYFFMDSRESAYEVLYDMYYDGVDLSKSRFYIVILDSIWMRDYGPFTMVENGRKTVVDVNYYWNRQLDDQFPRLWARFKGHAYKYVDLDTEGGNFMTDGRGTAYISRSVYQFNSHLGTQGVNNAYRAMGCSSVQSFEWLLNDGTTHIDMYAKILNSNTVLVSKAVGTFSMNHALLERNANKFRQLGWNVVRATMADDDLSSYSNSLIVGNTVLMPTYAHATRDAAAAQVYRNAGYKNVVGIDCRTVIRYGGAIHCISMQCAR